jgi:pyridoxal phosphate enzyme (YggS family)
MIELKTRLQSLKKTINQAEMQVQRPINSVQLLAVSKTWSADILRQATDAGQSHFGENYLQEALIKIEALKDLDITWHFIGPIQSNKTKDIAQHFSWVQSVDRLKIAQRLNNQRPTSHTPLNICIQVNIDDEKTKSGVNITETATLAKEITQLDRLILRGLMIIPAKTDDIEQQISAFNRAYSLYSSLKRDYPSMDTLSMGMSADMKLAIHHGSTMVRIGTGLFGQRHSPNIKLHVD